MSINLQDTSLPAKIWNDVNMLLLLSYCVIWMKYLNNNALILYLFFKLIKNTTSQQIMHILLDSRGHILEYETFQNETLCEVHIIFFIGIDLLFIQISCVKQKLYTCFLTFWNTEQSILLFDFINVLYLE